MFADVFQRIIISTTVYTKNPTESPKVRINPYDVRMEVEAILYIAFHQRIISYK